MELNPDNITSAHTRRWYAGKWITVTRPAYTDPDPSRSGLYGARILDYLATIAQTEAHPPGTPAVRYTAPVDVWRQIAQMPHVPGSDEAVGDVIAGLAEMRWLDDVLISDERPDGAYRLDVYYPADLNERFTARVAAAVELADDTDDLKAQIATLEATLTAERARHESHQKDYHDTLASLRADVGTARAERDRARAAELAATREREAARNERDNAITELNGARAARTEGLRRLDIALSQRYDATATLDAVRIDLTAAHAELDRLKGRPPGTPNTAGAEGTVEDAVATLAQWDHQILTTGGRTTATAAGVSLTLPKSTGLVDFLTEFAALIDAYGEITR